MSASNGRSSESSAERWLGMVGGIAFGVLTFIGWAFWAGPHIPELDATPARIGAWYAEHQGTVRVGVLCGVLALLPFMGFVVALYQRLRAAEGGQGTLSLVTLLGGILVCVVHFVFLSFLYVAAFRPRVVSPDVTTTLHNLGVQGGPASVLYITLLAGAAAVILRYGALPRWLGYAAIAAAVLQLSYLPGIPFTDGGIFDPTDGLLGVYADFGSFLTWCVLAGVAMSRVPVTRPRVAAVPDPSGVPVGV